VVADFLHAVPEAALAGDVRLLAEDGVEQIETFGGDLHDAAVVHVDVRLLAEDGVAQPGPYPAKYEEEYGRQRDGACRREQAPAQPGRRALEQLQERERPYHRQRHAGDDPGSSFE